MKAKSIKGSSPEEIQSALHHAIDVHFTPTLAIVFISIKQERNTVCEILQKEGIDVFGATSSTEFIDGNQSKGGIVVMLLDIGKEDYAILFEDIGERTLEEAAASMAQKAIIKFRKPSFILCSTSLTADGNMLDGETLIRHIENIVGPQLTLFGGMAGDDMTFTGTHVFTGQDSSAYGITALIFNEEKIAMYGVALSGWKPVGLAKKFTRCTKNLLYEIDGLPALEMYLKFLGEDFASTDDQIKFFESVGMYYPFQLERPGREPMMCNPIGYNKEENALIMESDVVEGTRFRFSTPPDFDIVETVVNKAGQIKATVNENADAVLVFSCASRLHTLGPMAQQENDGLSSIWKAPMAGFYTYGEFGRAENGKHEFHSTTCSWVALKEK